jgi:hypothetical protein
MDLATLDALTGEGQVLLLESNDSQAQAKFRQWDCRVGEWLTAEAPQTGLSAEWSALGYPRLDFELRGWARPQLWVEYRQIVQTRLEWLSRLARSARIPGGAGPDGADLQPGDKIFVVHGHNREKLETVARFIERLQLTPIILHERPNEGRTIIEKFTDFADVGFAVVILTGDDQGGVRTSNVEAQRLRARQNVIFELGFFLGKLGRKRVCALYEENVEIPSYYSGVLFVALDANDAWKVLLAREMRAAGFPVDLNLIL